MRRSDKDAPALSGLLVLDKPVGWTSMDAVARVRARAAGARTGHAGTLDPLATGVLVVAIGQATKSLDRFMETAKRYVTEIDLGAFTTTDDREGARTEVPVAQPPSDRDVRAALASFVGEISQRPPAYSAMKVGGRRAYALARAGAAPQLAPRTVRIDRIELRRYAYPSLEIEIDCGKGTYIRSLARDLGERLGTGGHCAALRRTAVGPFDERMAIPIDALPERLGSHELIALDAALALVASPRERGAPRGSITELGVDEEQRHSREQ